MNCTLLLVLTAVPLGLVLLLLSNGWLTNAAFGQVTMPSVKIISPTEGEQIKQGNGTLAFKGTSSDNSTSNCEVSLILNDIKPYQTTLPVKDKDYSSWTFILSSSYTPIKEGPNKATAKISCMDTTTNNMKWYSRSFIGIRENATKNDNSTPTVKTVQNLSNQKVNNVSVSRVTSLNNTNGTTNDVSSQISSLIEPVIPKQLTIVVKLSKNPISRGSLQTANVSVSDLKTMSPVDNATVETSITAPSGKTVRFEHVTSSAGEASFSWKVPIVSETGLVHIKLHASATGYETNQALAAYEVVKNSRAKSLNPFN